MNKNKVSHMEKLKTIINALDGSGVSYDITQTSPEIRGFVDADVGRIYFVVGEGGEGITEEEFVGKIQKVKDDIYNSEK